MMTLKELLSAYRNNDKPLYLVLEDVGECVSAGIIYCATYSNTDIDPFNKLGKLKVIDFYTEIVGENPTLHVNISLPNASFLK
jgi:hypothetical protein